MNENGPLKVNTARPVGRFAVEVTFYQRLQTGKIRAYEINKENAENRGELVGKIYDVGDQIPCTFELTDDAWRDLLKSLLEEAAREKITVETGESYAKGKLEAVEHHLSRAEKLIDYLLPVLKP